MMIFVTKKKLIEIVRKEIADYMNFMDKVRVVLHQFKKEEPMACKTKTKKKK